MFTDGIRLTSEELDWMQSGVAQLWMCHPKKHTRRSYVANLERCMKFGRREGQWSFWCAGLVERNKECWGDGLGARNKIASLSAWAWEFTCAMLVQAIQYIGWRFDSVGALNLLVCSCGRFNKIISAIACVLRRICRSAFLEGIVTHTVIPNGGEL